MKFCKLTITPMTLALLAVGLLACGPAGMSVQSEIGNVPAQAEVRDVLPTPDQVPAISEPLTSTPAAPPIASGAFTVTAQTDDTNNTGNLEPRVTPIASGASTVTAQTDDSNNTDSSEPTVTPHPTKVGADQEKYPNLRGRLRSWALAAEAEEEASKSDDGTRHSSQPVGPSQDELGDNGGVIGARVRVDTRVADAGSTVKAWLTKTI